MPAIILIGTPMRAYYSVTMKPSFPEKARFFHTRQVSQSVFKNRY